MTTKTLEQSIQFQTSPDQYRHWALSFDGDIATLAMNVNPMGGMFDGYELKLNSYDLGVDIELNDAINRIRFEHPEVRCLVLTGSLDRVFCAGANIVMLRSSSHAFKVNFCKYTNETRLGIEDLTDQSGVRSLAALNGTASGGGYELALACERILLVDDRNSAVSFPEVPLLGVLPGTGGLTRITDKRKIRPRPLRCVLFDRGRHQRQARRRMGPGRPHVLPIPVGRNHHRRSPRPSRCGPRSSRKGNLLAARQRRTERG